MMKRQAEIVLTSNLQTMNNTNDHLNYTLKRDDQERQNYKSVMPVSELLPAVEGQQKQIKAMVQTKSMIQNST